MLTSTTKTQPTHFNINELVRLSESVNTLQHRLLATSQILRYLAKVEYAEDWFQWIIDTSNWQVSKSIEPISLTEEMYNTLKVFTHTVNENADSIIDVDLDEKRQLIAVIAFMICFRSNPFLGKKFYDKVVISHAWVRDYFGINRTFSFKEKGSNHPDGYYQSKTIEFWESLNNTDLNSILKIYFNADDTTVVDGINSTVFSMISKLKTGSQSGLRMYLTDNVTGTPFLLTDNKYLLDPSLNIIGFSSQKTENGRTDLYLHNLSGAVWEVITASGNKINIHPGKDMPVRSKMAISIPVQGIGWNVEGAL